MRTPLLLVSCASVLFAASSQAADTQPYALEKDSAFEYGCFGPCACPVLVQDGLGGAFLLQPRGPDGLFYVYDVLDVRWLVPSDGDSIPVTGYGTYRIGGEVANQEQLTLNLSIAGGAPRIYDSGLVAKANEFPGIDLDVKANSSTCFDTVFAVHAAPTSVTGIPGSSVARFGIAAVTPNPTRFGASVAFVLDEDGPARVTVWDARGRRTTVLLDASRMDAGPHTLIWNGVGENGAPTPPGVYLIELTAGQRRAVSRVIKLSPGGPARVPFGSP